ncbi:MAG: tetratricopeptide repeat protein [candidate division Zixibacteria bacterium]|nr:tetratricopeptide repeat protein [candidate division Zixibacteria bacterium]
MKKHLFIIALSLLFILFFILVVLDYPKDSSAIPITTRSQQARQDFLKGRDLAERLREREACDYFEKAVAEDPQFAYACLYLSRLHPSVKTRLNFLIRAEELSSNVSEGERLLILGARAYNNRQALEERQIMQQLIEAYPDDARAHNEFGNTLFWQKDWSGAINEYLIAVRLEPSYSQPYNGLGYCYRFVGDLTTAENYFLKYLELLPDDPNPYDSYADLLNEMGRHEEAITIYRKAIEIRPDFSRSHLGIAWNLCVLGEYPQAIDQLNQLYSSSSDDFRRRTALFGMAVTYADQGDLERASSVFQSACEIDKASSDHLALSEDLNRLGLVFLEAGRLGDASRTFTAALQTILEAPGTSREVIENTQLDHMHNFVLVSLTKHDLATALDLAQNSFKSAESSLDPKRVQQAHQLIGLTKLASGDLNRAIDELNQSDVTEAYTQYHLALAYEGTGDYAHALKYYRLASTYDQFNPLTQAFVRKRAKTRVESLLLARQDVPTAATTTDSLITPIAHQPGETA